MQLSMENRIHQPRVISRRDDKCRDNDERRKDFVKRALYTDQERVKVTTDNTLFAIDYAIKQIKQED